MNGSPAISMLKRVQRWQSTQRSRSSRTWVEILTGLAKVRLVSRIRLSPRPLLIAWFCSGHSPPLSQIGQSKGWLMSRNSICPFCALSATSLLTWVFTTMPGATVIVQLGCGLGIGLTLPSRSGIATSTRHCRHAPTGSSSGWSQKRGMAMPSSSATRMISDPLGDCTSIPSTVQATRSLSAMSVFAGATLLAGRATESSVPVVRLMRHLPGRARRRRGWSGGTGRAPTRACGTRRRTPRGSTGWHW